MKSLVAEEAARHDEHDEKERQHLLVLSGETRLRLLELLARREQGYCVEDLARLLGIKPEAVSWHLQKMREEGYVGFEQVYKKYRRHYYIREEALYEATRLFFARLGLSVTIEVK